MKTGYVTRIRRQVERLTARQHEEAIRLCLTAEELGCARAALRHAVRQLERRAR